MKKKLLEQDSDQTVRWHESYCYLLVSPELNNSLSIQKISLIKIWWFQAGKIGLEVKIQKADFTGGDCPPSSMVSEKICLKNERSGMQPHLFPTLPVSCLVYNVKEVRKE